MEIEKLNKLIYDFTDKLSNSPSDEESVIYRKQLLDNNRKLKECQDKLDELTQKTFDEKISIKRKKDYELISSFSDDVLKDMNSNFKNFNYSAREDIINLLVDFGLEYIEKAINHFELKDYEKCIEYANKAILYCETELAWVYKAEYHMALGDLDNAILCCDEAIKIHSDCYIAWLHKTNSYIQLFRFNLSLECANKLVEINDKDYMAWILKSISYSKQMGKSKHSQGMFQ